MNSPVKVARAWSTTAARRHAAPDGGYGWFVLLSCFLVFGLTFGVIKAFGVFFVEIQRYFETTATAASWITAIAVGVIHVGAPLASSLSACFGHRCVVTLGGLLCTAGTVGGAYASSLTQLYVTVGLVNGLGSALAWTPTVTMLGLYFERRRPMANALASAGECVLTFVLTPLFQLLVDLYTWRGAMLLLGALQLHLAVCGMLLRPLPAGGELAKVTEEEVKDGDEEGLARGAPPLTEEDDLCARQASYVGRDERAQTGAAGDDDSVGSLRGRGGLESRTAGEILSVPAQAKAESRRGAELRSSILRYVDYTLITNARFMVYSMFGVFAALGFFAPALFLVPFARSRGVHEYQAAALMSISAALDLTGRVFFGWVANLRVVETIHQLTASVFLLGGVLLLCPLASSFAHLAAFSAIYGLVFGATVSIHITVLAEVVGVHRLGSALGFFMLIRSSGGLLGPPIAGLLIDKMSDYGTGFLMAGVALIVSALFLLLLDQMTRRGQGSSSDAYDPSADSEKDAVPTGC